MRISQPVRKIFPVSLLLDGKKAVVAGGGKVGARKVELLLSAGCSILVVSPFLCDELAALAEAGAIEHLARDFQTGDERGAAICFACTDDRSVNRGILNAAKSSGIICCCADGNWPDGDFVTPAVIRSGDLTFSISTGGKSCRQAKLVKDSLQRHLDAVKGSDLMVIGTDHECLPARERAPFHLNFPERRKLGDMVRRVTGVAEFMLLNTCNRIELAAVVSEETAASGILQRMMRFDDLQGDEYYVKRGFDAFAHLCQVTAGMDSQIPGEFHVVSQVKEALDEACTFGWASSIMREWTDAAFHVSKDIRHAIGSLLDVEEIEEVALRFADHASSLTRGRAALVLGTGVLGRGLVAGLGARGFKCHWAYHSNRPDSVNGENVIQLDEIDSVLPECGLIVSALSASEPVVTAERHRRLLSEKGVLMIDLGMPRNLDPELGGGNVRLADLDLLKQWHRSMNGSLGQARKICQQVLEEHRPIYERMRSGMRPED